MVTRFDTSSLATPVSATGKHKSLSTADVFDKLLLLVC